MKKYYFPFYADNKDWYKCKVWIPKRKHYKKARFRKAFQRGLDFYKEVMI